MAGENQSDQHGEPHQRRGESVRQVEQGSDTSRDEAQQAEQVWQHRQWGRAYERRKHDPSRASDGRDSLPRTPRRVS